MYDYFLFDLDGTIVDSGLGITNSVMYALKKWNIEVGDRTELYRFVGPPLYESFEKFYGFSKEDAIKAVEAYREYYREKGVLEYELYEGIADTLKELKARGKKIILATSKPEVFATMILKHSGLFELFDFIAGATLDGSLIKKEDVIAYALKGVGNVDTKKAVMVGDRSHDIMGAHMNGIDSVGVTYGYGSREELAGENATYIIDKATDILNFT
ncbi:MAG: HAD family hydrolase [Clostridia bacterium]|nr:HAD family hydrolase [Clostridia bacterium]